MIDQIFSYPVGDGVIMDITSSPDLLKGTSTAVLKWAAVELAKDPAIKERIKEVTSPTPNEILDSTRTVLMRIASQIAGARNNPDNEKLLDELVDKYNATSSVFDIKIRKVD